MIATVGFNPELEALVVQFSNGKFYRYDGVPSDVFVGVLTNKESHGRAFNELVKPAFKGTIIEAPDVAAL